MKKIEQFYITELTLAGFKNYLEPATFVFGNPTVITGGNGQGKSTLADAVAFAVTGLPFFGERGIDRLYNDAMKQQMELSVRLRFVDQDGAAHELYRLRKNSRMVITYDGYDIRQTDLTDMFGERDVFLSIFNPLYFIEVLEDDGKNLLERYLPVIPHETVLSQLSEHVQESLKDEEILSPEVYLKSKREQIRELEEQIIYLTGQKDLTCLQGRESSKVSASLNEQLQSLQEEAGHLEQKRFSGLEPKEMERQLVELSRQYDETSRDLRSAERFSEIDGQISELTQKVAARQAESYQSKFLQPLADISARVSELGRRYKQELHNFQSFAPGVCCPTCHRPITEAALEEVRAETEKFVQALIAQGKEQQAQFAELKALDQQAAETFVQFKQDDLRAWLEELERLRSQRRELEEDRRGEEQLETLREQIQELTSALEYGNLTQAGYDRLKECKEEIRELEAKIEANQTTAGWTEAEFNAQIENTRSQITELREKISDAIIYISKRTELTFAPLKLNRVAISLYDIVKSTGERKDAFRFTYQAEGCTKGRLYKCLSHSERLRAGMEVSEMVKRLTGRNYPVFADDMESIEDLSNVKPTGQVIMARVVPHAPLSVQPLQPIQASAQAQAA